MSVDRAPVWPPGVIGSISHNQLLAGAAVAKSTSLIGIGIDLEVMGRVKGELARFIRTPEDLKTHNSYNESELLTIIFSAKESLYKALYPIVKCFFGFEAAAVREVDHLNCTFKIDLLKNLSDSLGPSGRFQFEGHFKIIEKNCLTVLEIID
jgi:4'-phosphopantetheinyl transferase EntD